MNKKIFPASPRKLLLRYYKRLLILCIPAFMFIFAAFLITLLFVIPEGVEVPRFVNRLILSGLSISLLYAFIVCTFGGKIIDRLSHMHKSHSFIQINEKSLVVSEYSHSGFFSGKIYKKLWICDIRDIDDIIIKNNVIIFKLKSNKVARFYKEQAADLAFHSTDNEIIFDDFTAENRGISVGRFAVTDNFALPLRIAQRIFLVAGNVREREARRARFRDEMLERAAKAKRYTRLRDRWRPEVKRGARW